MEDSLSSLCPHLERTLDILKSDSVQRQLHDALHKDEKGFLPDPTARTHANRIIDLMHEIEQILSPGDLILADHFFGYIQAKCLVATADLNIADILHAQGSMSSGELAKACGAHPVRLHQILRILAGNGVFQYDEAADCFSNNRTSKMLQSDHWGQWRDWALLKGNQYYEMARGIPDSIQEGTVRCPAQINYNTDDNMFTYFQKQGWLPQLHRTFTAGANAQAPGILADYPWGEVSATTVIDIGGGGGALIALLLRAHPQMRGGVYDLPSVIEHITPFFHAEGGQYSDLSLRVPRENLIAGDFFSSIPPSSVYTIKWCLHDWTDEQAIIILRNIHSAIIHDPNSRLIVLECVMDFTWSSRLSRYGDLNMMVASGGRERTLKEWTRLAKESGWHIHQVHPLRNAWPSAIDMRPLFVNGQQNAA